MITIVFNRGAIAVGLIALLFFIPIWLLRWMEILDSDSALLIGSWALFAASLVATMYNLRGRLFFILPTWLITLPCAIYASYILFDQVISITKIIALAFVLLIALLLVLLFFQEKSQIRNLSKKVIQLPDQSAGVLLYWQGIRNLVFTPLFSKWTEDICEYNIRVLQFLKENNVEIAFSEEFLAELVNTRDKILNGIKQEPDKKIQNSFISEINYQIKIRH